MEKKKIYIVSFEIESSDEASVYQMVNRIVDDYRTHSFSIVEKGRKEIPSVARSGRFVNTGATIRLSELVTSEDVSDDTIINIFESDGSFVARGHWYDDRILNQCHRMGTAHRAGTGLSISFNLH